MTRTGFGGLRQLPGNGIPTVLFVLYSGDLKSDHSKFGSIQNLDFLKLHNQMVQFSKGQAIAIVQIDLKTGLLASLDRFIYK